MKKTLLAFVLSLLALFPLLASPSYAVHTLSTPSDNPSKFHHVGTLQSLLYGPPIPSYGPPLPNDFPSSISRSGINLLASIQADIPETLTYVVQHGDSLSSIAAAFHTETQTLVELNHVANANVLHVHQELQIPNLERKLMQPHLVIKNVLHADLTAYTAGYESTGKHPGDPGYGITASGKVVRDHQTIAVDPSVIPLGTKVYIEGIGVRVAEDTGGAIVGNRIDVYMSDLPTAIQFGYKKHVNVYVLDSQTG